jgi:phage gpG-like protein
VGGIDATVHGVPEWGAAIDAVMARVDRETDRGMRESLRIVERSYKKILRTYTHPEGTPTTSPPGQPPALVTGTLMRSVKSRGPRPGRRRYVYVGEVGPTAVYARIQDLGGRVRSRNRGHVGPQTEHSYTRIPARPYAKPATDRVRRDVRRVFQRRWGAALTA